jgi:MoaA/NifB/PqqE/SkfB family radical SAM enzyme
MREFLGLIAENSSPALLLSGGEPLCHEKFFYCLDEAKKLGLKVTVSTNGTLIDGTTATRLADASSYVGVSVDGLQEIHDKFRGASGSFEAAMKGIELLASCGCRVGLRFTLARPQLVYLDEILAFAESLPIDRICFYHFMSSGRGAEDDSLVPERDEENNAVSRIIRWADTICAPQTPGRRLEILTVGAASDNVLIYEYLAKAGDPRISHARTMMRRSSRKVGGSGILSVRWDGVVFQNQFAWNNPLGSWRGLGEIARAVDSGSKFSPECETCDWRARNICGGRGMNFGRECRIPKERP